MGVDGNYDWGNREYFLTKNGIRSTAVNILKALKGRYVGWHTSDSICSQYLAIILPPLACLNQVFV